MDRLFVVHVEERYLGEVVVPAKNKQEARDKAFKLMLEADSSVFSLDSAGYEIVNIDETDKEEAESNHWSVIEG